MNALPENTFLQGISPTYNQHSFGLEMAQLHSLPAYVWGLVRVFQGEVILHLEGGGGALTLTPDTPGVIPRERHFKLEPTGKPVRFHIEYHHEPILRDGAALAGSLRRA